MDKTGRMTAAEFRKWLESGETDLPPERPDRAKPPRRKNKFNAEKTKADGIPFDSKREAEYYEELKLKQRTGIITGFGRQVRFVVAEGMEYVADFVEFYPDGSFRIVDVKGFETEVFKMKMKLFKEKYPRLRVELER